MSVSITLEAKDLSRANIFISRLANLDEQELLTVIGATGESQTRRRIEEEKTAPDGTPWPPNTEGTSTLRRTGRHLVDSIAYEVGNAHVSWGSSWEFAAVHQYGATILPKNARLLSFITGGARVFAKKVTIPARPFVGLSQDNAREIEGVVTDYLKGLAR